MSHQSTEFLGTGVVGSDYLDLIVRRGEEGMVRVGLTEYFNRATPLLSLSHLPARSAEADTVAEVDLTQSGSDLLRASEWGRYPPFSRR